LAKRALKPAKLLLEHLDLFLQKTLPGPVLDLACGKGDNGVFLAQRGYEVTCCDISPEILQQARKLAETNETKVEIWQVDLEREGVNPLPVNSYGAILVFRYLHRPLLRCIKKGLKNGGLLVYETFTVEQAKLGKPRNPDFLLSPGELLQTFEDWQVIHYFEGIKENPTRAVAQLVCRKPEGIVQRAWSIE
jgi:SAM-dependent methyltransferase